MKRDVNSTASAHEGLADSASNDVNALAIVLQRVVGSNMLPLRAQVRLVRKLCHSVQGSIDTDFMWKEVFTQQFRDRDLVPATASRHYLQRLMSRELPNGAFVVQDPAQRPEIVPSWEASVVVMGPPHAGKTWLVNNFCTGGPPTRLDNAPFLGCDMRAAVVQLRGFGEAPEETSFGRIRIWEPSGLSRQQAHGGYLKSSAVALVVVKAGDPLAAEQAREHIAKVTTFMRAGTVIKLCGTQADLLSRQARATAAAQLRAVAIDTNVEFALCSATTGEGIYELFCQALVAACETGRLATKQMPILSHAAGSMNNSELLRALLHRR